jgi:integrase
MGRLRKREKHLPRRMYLYHGGYRYHPLGGKPVQLGSDLGAALVKYASLIGHAWSLRTLGDAIDRYRAEVLPLKKAKQTRDEEGKSLDRLKKAFGHFLPDNLTAPHCYAYMDARRGKDGERVLVAARHEMALLRHVFSSAIEWGIASMNPVVPVKLPKRSGKRRKVQMEWVEQLRALASPRMRVAIDLAIMVGQRRADTLKLKWSDVSADGIYVKQGKTEAELLIAHSADLDELLDRAKALTPDIPREYILRKANGKPYTADGFSSNWQRLRRKYLKAGGEPFTFHDLRSVSADGAETVEEAQKRLGHASADTTRRFYWKNVTKARPRS